MCPRSSSRYMTKTFAPTKRNGRPSMTKRKSLLCTKPARPRLPAPRQLEMPNKTAAPAISANAARTNSFLCMNSSVRTPLACRTLGTLARIRQSDKSHDCAERANDDEDIEECPESQHRIQIALLSAGYRQKPEQQKLNVINQQAHCGQAEPARRSSERPGSRKSHNRGHQPRHAAENERSN